MKVDYSDSELLGLVQKGEKERLKAVAYIYEVNSFLIILITQYLSKAMARKLAEESAEGVYHLAIAILVEKIVDGKLIIQQSIKSYLKGIAINLSKQKIETVAKKTTVSLNVIGDADFREDNFSEKDLMDREWKFCVDKAFGKLKNHCKQILRFRMLRYSFKEIAQKMGYKNDTVDRTTHARCRQGFINIIQNDADLKQRIDELLKDP